MKPFLLAVAGALTMCGVQAMAAETYALDLINNSGCVIKYALSGEPEQKVVAPGAKVNLSIANDQVAIYPGSKFGNSCHFDQTLELGMIGQGSAQLLSSNWSGTRKPLLIKGNLGVASFIFDKEVKQGTSSAIGVINRSFNNLNGNKREIKIEVADSAAS
ncbi:hypothetical protein VI26_11590 [Chromobacterium sp. LK1]|uniref:hypothetical protein n=1 Tax=Chromobacterium sp. LK1 TaxID=1628193 RepID=UPI000653D25D|nr:hypothetical protein [Chromobacterium sp. LK1]KMN35416.1 hypothetical protein VI26_11590 [Chromobacterium sp. LK1]